jgi:HSP20 family molecular chaperone IbpA
MDDDAKKFFEGLSGDAEEEVNLDSQIEMVKSSSLPTAQKKSSKKSETDLSELLEEGEGQLSIDVFQTPTEIVVESTIAGVKPEDLDIDITNESVTIRGRRVKENKISDEDYFYQECYWGKFSRSIILPQEVDAENAEASLKNGVLTVRLPKIDRQKSKKLKVNFS